MMYEWSSNSSSPNGKSRDLTQPPPKDPWENVRSLGLGEFPWTWHIGEGSNGFKGFRALFEVEMLKTCTGLWHEAHLEVKMPKTLHVRTTFGRSTAPRYTTTKHHNYNRNYYNNYN